MEKIGFLLFCCCLATLLIEFENPLNLWFARFKYGLYPFS
ncbi:hypothetical protein HBZS_123010 [Helicobacter bizzozeronii CCUG 35545]|nr:hypothetical protein HBZS_123010 [Helicobacter bizzozeronii CCUG 35545]